jgi:hypothetical protein
MATTLPARLTEVAQGVWVATSSTWATNTTIVVSDDDALIIDPALSEGELSSLAAVIEERGWRLTSAVSTHPHWDHMLWSRALDAVSWGDCPRFASPRAVDVAAEQVDLAWEDAAATAPGLDRSRFANLTRLGSAEGAPPGRTVHLLPPAPVGVKALIHDAHAPGHMAIIARGVLAAGDMLSDTEIPLLDLGPHGDGRGAPWDPVGDYLWALDCLWRAVLDETIKVLVPGHGSVAQGQNAIMERIQRDRVYLHELSKSSRPVANPWPRSCANPACWCLGARNHATTLVTDSDELAADATSSAAVHARDLQAPRTHSQTLADTRLMDTRLADPLMASAHARHLEHLAVNWRQR